MRRRAFITLLGGAVWQAARDAGTAGRAHAAHPAADRSSLRSRKARPK